MPSDWQAKKPPSSGTVVALITTVLGAAIPCRRAARLGVSPRAKCSCRVLPPISPTTTSPVWMPRRHSQLHTALLGQAGIQWSHGLHDAQPGPHGALGIIFVRLRIAKVDEQTIAEILGDMPLKTGDHLGAGLLIGPHHLTQLFWVEPAGKHRRIHQVTKEHGELATFGVRELRFGW